ncbi:Os03g0325266 [Oryza sativa Japonica Group]|uniref:Os03g0325266 protein n=1 Tax=Oryza sativa subsp. japonica TaxID=39947 RepID=A0A0P0VWX3_ORYSJ|nr:hypothetical protein DAI22_03g162700 [Oryza sativa Japonica Group]BAS83981.1 Os03g0325266 [Oryza sativa Japonica Group]
MNDKISAIISARCLLARCKHTSCSLAAGPPAVASPCACNTAGPTRRRSRRSSPLLLGRGAAGRRVSCACNTAGPHRRSRRADAPTEPRRSFPPLLGHGAAGRRASLRLQPAGPPRRRADGTAAPQGRRTAASTEPLLLRAAAPDSTARWPKPPLLPAARRRLSRKPLPPPLAWFFD